MAEKRRTFFNTATERRERLARIARSTPPPATFDDEEEAPASKPALRQSPPAQKTKLGESPWWASVKPGEMTKTAEAQIERMETERPKVARSVSGRINEV